MMKKFIIINIFLIIFILSIVPKVNVAINITDDMLGDSIDKINTVLESKKYVDNPNYITEIVDENNNVPSYQYYPTHLASRSIKTLKAHDGKIFMGLGDWNDNTGPVKIIYYDTVDGKIKTSGTIADEAVQIFNVIDGKLYTTGCDPRDEWGFGSFYTYNKETSSWEQHRRQNGWIHVFNIVEFKDKLYMCGSTVDSTKTTSIQSSSDNGETFQNVPVYKNGTLLPYDSNLRCYNLMVYNNKLYGYYYSDYPGIYEYDEVNNRFDYISNIPSTQFSQYSISKLSNYNRIYLNYEIFNNEFLYISNDIYRTKDLKSFRKVTTKTKDVVQDTVVVGEKLYTLSYAYNSDKTFTVRIYSTKDLEEFNLEYEFETETPAFSLEYCNNSFYVGTAYGNSVSCINSSRNGSFYKIDLEGTKKVLNLDKENRLINIYEGKEIYSNKYNLDADKFTCEVDLNFDNNMTKVDFEQEYYKIEALDLIFAAIAYTDGVKIEDAISYFDDVLAKNMIKKSNAYSLATQYAQNIFSEDINIQDNLFTLTTTKTGGSENDYKIKAILTINNEVDFSIIKSSNGNEIEDKEDKEDEKDIEETEDKKDIEDKQDKEDIKSEVNDYIENNSKLPQTGKFFNLKNILETIILISIILIVCLIIKNGKRD